MTKNIIRTAAFDAKEPNNPLIDGEWFGERARANWEIIVGVFLIFVNG